MKNFVSDELANKVYHLTMALNQAEEIIRKLDNENENLKQSLLVLGVNPSDSE
jgi:hypothetical protein